MLKIYERLVCVDGASVSLQAGSCMYSSPREDGVDAYSAVEAGYPSVTPPASWEAYRQDEGTGHRSPTESIYPYLPAPLVLEFIDAHGGAASGECPPLSVTMRLTSTKSLWSRIRETLDTL